MSETIKKYSNSDITIQWQPEKCIHSTLCWKGLVQVFNPREKPWVKMDGASTEEIREQVKKCPSGALSFQNNIQEVRFEPNAVESEISIVVTENGPLLVQGKSLIKETNGTVHVKENTTALCRCGASSNKPFCDGTHRKINFKG
ncbi:MAG: (4Fe-4S)-binding protein [Bacteroidia bacterium]|nr:(4Fe-4S)-binding protein [Bacteroidia bacterium]MCF8425263.1 (4Fe-4S)-binding protein [Bacteroidia bacterium]MCF8446515.1 (4Fe-4S)-binding protein [Bacteroidia bacterium]